ncbi:MAG: pyridoxal-phosphate dependent enzyme [Alphaproteobacteria bacterium]|jgi:threonine dehydratase|nr:pyridoxal-phosphate dependent enzyme [Alphaproteobacteria bacterium]
MAVSLAEIETASELLRGVVVRTPCIASGKLSVLTGADLRLKLENLQYTGSFKDRGALVKLASLTAAERGAGVIAVSAGNHAQGVAYHAQRLGIPAVIVMPVGTPNTKVRQTEALGATVRLHGESLDEAAAFADELRSDEGLTFVPPYDDPRIVAGQGTVGLELLADAPDLDCLVVPIGGGGLIAGIASAVKTLRPEIEIIGVESALYPSMRGAIRGEAAACGGQTLADGIAVKAPGQLTRPIALLLEEEKIVAEGAGAAALAAVLSQPARFAGRRVGLVVSGGNIDVRLLASLLMRGLVRDGRVASMRVEIADHPGALAAIAAIVADCGANILEVTHQRAFLDVPAKRADLDVVVETRDPAHIQVLVDRLQSQGYAVEVLTDVAGGTVG